MSDLLPPGNQPAPAAGDDPRQFPDFFTSDMWPAMWPREIFAYANAAARDAELTGLGPSDIAFAWLKDLKRITVWNGTAWQNAHPVTLRGTDSITPTAANTPTKKTIALTAGFFSSVPTITLTIISTVPGTTVTGISVDNVSATSFDVWLTRTNTTGTGFQWMATA